MSVLMLALGSRGDVQPMAVLAGELTRRGVPARVVALAEYEGLVTGEGGGFVPVPAALADSIHLTHSRVGKVMLSSAVGQAVLLQHWLRGIADQVADTVLGTVQEGETVLAGVLVRDVATALVEGRGCRMATVLFTGQLPTDHPESHFSYQHYTRWQAWNRWGAGLNWEVASTLGAPVSKRVRSRLGLPWPGRAAVTAAADAHPVVMAVSPVLLPPAPDWPANAHQTGHLVPQRPQGTPDPALVDFLHAGDPPVYVGFGSMAGSSGHDSLDLVVEAARRTGTRVVTPALDDVAVGPVAEDVLAIRPASHEWLLPRTAGVVHHGGSGTTWAGLRSGRPSVAVPFGVDQPFHAKRLHELGVGPSPVPVRRLTGARLARLVGDLVKGPHAASYGARAAAVGETCRAEDGLGETVRLLERLDLL